jgi:hypothetical protein
VTQEIPDVFFVMKFRAQTHRETLHREQVGGLGDHDAQMIQIEERCEIAAAAQSESGRCH